MSKRFTFLLMAERDGDYDVLGTYEEASDAVAAMSSISATVYESTKKLTKKEFMAAYANDEEPEPKRVWVTQKPYEGARQATATMVSVPGCPVPTRALAVEGSDFGVEPRVLAYVLIVPMNPDVVSIDSLLGDYE